MAVFTTDASGAWDDVKFGAAADIPPTDSTFKGLTVYDRDPFGYVAAQRNSSGTSAWTVPNLFAGCDTSNAGDAAAASSGFTGNAFNSCLSNGLLYQYRTDGYFDGAVTFRGVRIYDGDSQQWSTPDFYGGAAGNPMSGLGYNYAGNNPAMFADPSGFCSIGWGDGGPYYTIACDGSVGGGEIAVSGNAGVGTNCTGGGSGRSTDMMMQNGNPNGNCGGGTGTRPAAPHCLFGPGDMFTPSYCQLTNGKWVHMHVMTSPGCVARGALLGTASAPGALDLTLPALVGSAASGWAAYTAARYAGRAAGQAALEGGVDAAGLGTLTAGIGTGVTLGIGAIAGGTSAAVQGCTPTLGV